MAVRGVVDSVEAEKSQVQPSLLVTSGALRRFDTGIDSHCPKLRNYVSSSWGDGKQVEDSQTEGSYPCSKRKTCLFMNMCVEQVMGRASR